MSTLRINNIEAKSVPASPTLDEKIKLTNSSGDVLVHVDGKTSGITTIGINTTAGNITFDANSNVVVTGIITATKFVGTIEPTNLTVSGDLTIPDKIIHSGDTNTAIRFPAADTITAETGGSERARIDSSGRLCVNTTSTGGAKLEVADSSFHQGYFRGTGNVGGIRLGNSTNANAFIYYDNGKNMNFQIGTGSGGAGQEIFRITSTGGLKFTGQTSTIETAGITHHTNNNLYIRGGSSGLILSNDDSTNTIHISESNFIKFETNDGTERLRITSTGSVGIGTDNPKAQLEVYKVGTGVTATSVVRGEKAVFAIMGDATNTGASETDARLVFSSDGDENPSKILTSPLATHGFEIALINEEPGAGLRFHDGTANAERLRINSDGRIIPTISGGTGGVGLVGAFSAKPTSTYSVASGLRKINLGTEEFDANGWFNTSNSRYTPLCKGWYQFNFFIQYQTNLNSHSIETYLYPHKNGSGLDGPVIGWSTNYGGYTYITYSTMIFCNGSSDYIEMYSNCSRSTQVSSASRMSGFLVHPVA